MITEFECACVCTMDSHAYFMKETSSSPGIRGGTGPQCPLQNFLAAAIFPRKCDRCVKIERLTSLGKIVAATEFSVTSVS